MEDNNQQSVPNKQKNEAMRHMPYLCRYSVLIRYQEPAALPPARAWAQRDFSSSINSFPCNLAGLSRTPSPPFPNPYNWPPRVPPTRDCESPGMWQGLKECRDFLSALTWQASMSALELFRSFLYHSAHNGSQVQHAGYQTYSNPWRQSKSQEDFWPFLARLAMLWLIFSSWGVYEKDRTMYQAISLVLVAITM